MTTAPSGPQQPVREKKNKQTEERRKQVQEIEIANGEVDTNGAPESSTAHDGNNLNKASSELCATRHEQEQAPYGTQSATEACAVVRDNRDKRVGNMAEGVHVEPDESQVRWNEDGGHAEDRDGASGEDQTRCACA